MICRSHLRKSMLIDCCPEFSGCLYYWCLLLEVVKRTHDLLSCNIFELYGHFSRSHIPKICWDVRT